MRVRMMSYNLYNYGAASPRRESVHEVIRAADPDVLAVQEIHAPGDNPRPRAAQLVRELAAATGLCCETTGGQITVAVGNMGYHVAVLWRPGLTPLNWQPWSATLHHAMGTLVLDIGGTPVAHATAHLTPFGRGQRVDEAEKVVATMTRPPAVGGLLGMDANCVLADHVLLRVEHGDPTPYPQDEKTRYIRYDSDPFAHATEWSPEFVYQCDRGESPNTYLPGEKRPWRADRRTGDVLAAGLADAAVLTGTPWQQTAGHWPSDPYPDRRFDTLRVTPAFAPAVTDFQVIRTDLALSASDHLPIMTTYTPDRIPAAPRH